MLTLLRLIPLVGLWETAADDEPEDDQDGDDDDIRDPAAKIASMQDHIDRLHKRLEVRDGRIKELEDEPGTEDDVTIRVEAAFWRELAIGALRTTNLHGICSSPEASPTW
jgi:hypothetical protein